MLKYLTIPVTAMFAGLLAAFLWVTVWTTALAEAWSDFGILSVPVFLIACVGSAVCMRKFGR